MRLPVRAVLYGLTTWVVWVSLVVGAVEALPEAATGTALFVTLKTGALVTIVLGLALHYLRRAGGASTAEGLLLGLLWTAVLIVMDLCHYLMVPFDVGAYFATVAPGYVVVPVLTTLAVRRGQDVAA
ncbi:MULTISPECIES: hypothetical protein [Streptosporangium]|uniref:Uncharacterized protein n=1 Tax=Streptosporangium brasiliense TaxID=47480 RepID=A0ABT9RAR2_9ACTN|nr:hypothetical protein [Streptosporangium brasiliense]MDP9866340.1 hypothetical protein [Streptosporangium brasiliense]